MSYIVKEQGDANEYAILDEKGGWVAAIKLNGEFMVARQREIMAQFAASAELLEQLTLALPYVESAMGEQGYKPRAIATRTKVIRDAIAAATPAVGGVQPDPRAAKMIEECAQALEDYGDHQLGDL